MKKEFLVELIRLSHSFGIGVILLDLEDPDNSEIVIQADEEDALDWEQLTNCQSIQTSKNFWFEYEKILRQRKFVKNGMIRSKKGNR